MNKYNPDIHHRQSLRLKGYDYSQAGLYFITICTQNRTNFFGEIKNGQMILNEAGIMVKKVWDEIPIYYNGIDIDTFQIMPNHIHGIIQIIPEGADPRACPDVLDTCHLPMHAQTNKNIQNIKQMSLPDVVHRFKTMTTKLYTDGVKQKDWQPFDKRLWQRNYYERIIRDETAYFNISQYIINNPKNWETDENYKVADK